MFAAQLLAMVQRAAPAIAELDPRAQVSVVELAEAGALALELARSSASPERSADKLCRALDTLWCTLGKGSAAAPAAAAADDDNYNDNDAALYEGCADSIAALPPLRVGALVLGLLHELEHRVRFVDDAIPVVPSITINDDDPTTTLTTNGDRWAGGIRDGRKRKYVGTFVDETEAAHAFDAYAITNGIDVPLNFPDEDATDELVAEAERMRVETERKRAEAAHARASLCCQICKGARGFCRKPGTTGHLAADTASADSGRRLRTNRKRNNRRKLNRQKINRHLAQIAAPRSSSWVARLLVLLVGRPDFITALFAHFQPTLQIEATRVLAIPAVQCALLYRRDTAAAAVAQASNGVVGVRVVQPIARVVKVRGTCRSSAFSARTSSRRRRKRKRTSLREPEPQSEREKQEEIEALKTLLAISRVEEPPEEASASEFGPGFLTRAEREGLYTETQNRRTPAVGVGSEGQSAAGRATEAAFCARECVYSSGAMHVALARAIRRHQWHVANTDVASMQAHASASSSADARESVPPRLASSAPRSAAGSEALRASVVPAPVV